MRRFLAAVSPNGRRSRRAPLPSRSTARKLRFGRRTRAQRVSRCLKVQHQDPFLKRLEMTFSYSRLSGAILGFSLVFAAGSFGARAQDAAAGPANIGACPSNNDAAFADAMSKPHWNGWGV